MLSVGASGDRHSTPSADPAGLWWVSAVQAVARRRSRPARTPAATASSCADRKTVRLPPRRASATSAAVIAGPRPRRRARGSTAMPVSSVVAPRGAWEPPPTTCPARRRPPPPPAAASPTCSSRPPAAGRGRAGLVGTAKPARTAAATRGRSGSPAPSIGPGAGRLRAAGPSSPADGGTRRRAAPAAGSRDRQPGVRGSGQQSTGVVS